MIVAEGYMDVIALHGAGFTGAVAPLGTALTEGQLGELWKLADEPYLCFDGDNAGRRAAARAAERALPLLRAGKSLRFLALPAGEDPDSLIRVHGADAIRRVLDLARPLSDVVWDMETEGKIADTPERRASLQRAVEQRVGRDRRSGGARLLPDLTCATGWTARRRRPERPAWQPGERRVPRRSGRSPRPSPPARPPGAPAPTSSGSRQERALLGALIERPALLHVLAEEVWPLCRSPIRSWPALRSGASRRPVAGALRDRSGGRRGLGRRRRRAAPLKPG